jgi:hypothetical protein
MFYDIRKRENSENIQTLKQTNKYYDLASNFILLLPYPLIIFIDTDNTDLEIIIKNIRKNLSKFTYIYKINFEDTFFYKYNNIISNIQQHYTIYNSDKNKDTPLYITLNNNKFFCLEESIKNNFFNSSHFLWLDFGINHVAKNLQDIHTWILNIPDKIKQLCLNPYTEHNNRKDFFNNIYHHTAGGLFTGSKENILIYISLFKKKWEETLMNKWYQLDEAIMTMVQRDNPDLFHLYYGDYEGIISNYLKPTFSMNLIIRGFHKCFSFNNIPFLFNMCLYLLPYFELSENQKSQDFYDFIIYNIVSNYYCNNKLLLLKVICIINNKILSDDDIMKRLIKYNGYNLDFYDNKNSIIDFDFV